MNIDTTLQALQTFPQQLAANFAAIPAEFKHWTPPSWDGIPSEHFTAAEQVCHVRDIEIDGYHVRFHRMLNEDHPTLASIDSEALAVQRRYHQADVDEALQSFQEARAATVALIRGLNERQWQRTGVFEGYGPVSVRGLMHYLCSHDQQHLAGLQWLLGKIS